MNSKGYRQHRDTQNPNIDHIVAIALEHTDEDRILDFTLSGYIFQGQHTPKVDSRDPPSLKLDLIGSRLASRLKILSDLENPSKISKILRKSFQNE